MNFGQFQLPIQRTLDHDTTQTWCLVNMKHKHFRVVVVVLLLFLLLFDIFVPTSAHRLLFVNK